MWEQCPSFLFFLPCLCFPLLFCSCLLPSDFKLYHCLLLHQSLFPLISIFSRTCSLRSHLPEPVLIVSSSLTSAYISSVQLLSHVWLFATPWTVAHQASLSITKSQNLLKLLSIDLVMISNHLILCRPLLLSSIFTGSFPVSQFFA